MSNLGQGEPIVMPQPTPSPSGPGGVRFTPNPYLQGQLSQLYSRMSRPMPTSPFAMLGGGNMWMPQQFNRSQLAAKPTSSGSQAAPAYNPMEHSG